MLKKKYIDYQLYHDLVEKVIEQVRESEFKPDVVLGIARGGLMLADGLSRAFKVPMAVILASSYQGECGTQQGALRVSSSIATLEPVQGNVLLVDDLVDSGKTLLALQGHLTETLLGIQALRTAVIWVKPKAVIQPTYSAEYLDENTWIVQPFETRDF